MSKKRSGTETTRGLLLDGKESNPSLRTKKTWIEAVWSENETLVKM